MRNFIIPGLAAIILLGRADGADPVPAVRPATWAQALEVQGVPNLHRVTATLYRSAQPTAEGVAKLKAMGIGTIINLRAFHSDREAIGPSGVNGEHIPANTWHPEDEDVVRFLRAVNRPGQGPVLVHCQHGADRTGVMCAVYRVAVQGWTKEEAIREMTQGGYGFHGIWQNLIDWVRQADIAALRKQAGIKEPARPGP